MSQKILIKLLPASILTTSLSQSIKNNGIKIWGRKTFPVKKKYIIKNFLKDHRIFMLSAIAALSLGGNWKIYDPNSFKTSFPTFLKTLISLGAKIKWKIKSR